MLKEHTAAGRATTRYAGCWTWSGSSDVATKKVRALSGGMRQRLGLAQALLGRPEVLVLDEPTVGLDPEQRMRFRDLVSDAGRGRTVILSTHQTEDVAAVCTDVVVVKDGRSLFTGTPAELAGGHGPGLGRRRPRPAGGRGVAGRGRALPPHRRPAGRRRGHRAVHRGRLPAAARPPGRWGMGEVA